MIGSSDWSIYDGYRIVKDNNKKELWKDVNNVHLTEFFVTNASDRPVTVRIDQKYRDKFLGIKLKVKVHASNDFTMPAHTTVKKEFRGPAMYGWYEISSTINGSKKSLNAGNNRRFVILDGQIAPATDDGYVSFTDPATGEKVKRDYIPLYKKNQ